MSAKKLTKKEKAKLENFKKAYLQSIALLDRLLAGFLINHMLAVERADVEKSGDWGGEVEWKILPAWKELASTYGSGGIETCGGSWLDYYRTMERALCFLCDLHEKSERVEETIKAMEDALSIYPPDLNNDPFSGEPL